MTELSRKLLIVSTNNRDEIVVEIYCSLRDKWTTIKKIYGRTAQWACQLADLLVISTAIAPLDPTSHHMLHYKNGDVRPNGNLIQI